MGAIFADGATGDVALYPPYTANAGNCQTVNLTNVGNTMGLPLGSTLLTTSVSICGQSQLDLLNGTAPVQVQVQIRTILGATITIPVNITLANISNPTNLVTGVLGQTGGPAVTYDAAAVSAITGFGSSGTVAGTFRAIAPN